MQNTISPKYLMKLTSDVEQAIWAQYSSHKNVRFYIDKWHLEEGDWNNYGENFRIIKAPHGEIDLASTLHGIDGETLMKIAIDLGVETPDFIPCIPTFRNEIKSTYTTASGTFEKAFKEIESHPDIAIGLANSALESIIKEILKDGRISTAIKPSETLYAQASELLKVFQLFPNSSLPVKIKTIGSSMLAINQSIEKLRSEKTNVHGKTETDYVITDPLYAYFVLNSVTTVGMFLNSYYKQKFPPITARLPSIETDDLPF